MLNNSKDLKKLTMICVLYETGARVSEFINIKLSDLNLSDNASITLYGKGNKTRIVPISQELVKLINKYLKEVYINYDDDYLFYSNYKKKYNRSSINKKINALVNDLKIKYPNYFRGNYFPHSFRHTKATHLYNNGTPLLYVKDFWVIVQFLQLKFMQLQTQKNKEKKFLKILKQLILKINIAITKKMI